MFLTTSDGFRLAYLYTKIPDSKKCIIFAHGMTVDMNDENKFVRAEKFLNQEGFSTIRFDFRAHGQSSGNSILDFTISGELTDLETIVSFSRNDGNEWIGLAGASFGGAVVALFSGKNPSKVSALFLANPVLDFEESFLKPTTTWGKKTFNDVWNRLNNEGFVIAGSKRMKLGKKLFEEMLKFNILETLQNYGGPLKVIHGDKDSMINYQHTKKIFENLRSNQKFFETIKGSDHGFHEEPYETQAVENVFSFFKNTIKVA